MVTIKLRDFLKTKTKVKELCIILEYGYRTAACWIDHEDLFIAGLPTRLLDMEVKKDDWELLDTVDALEQTIYTTAHYIYL